VLKDASAEWGPVMHGFTYSGHPVGSALGVKNLEIMERENLPAQAAEVGPYLLAALRQRVGDHPHVGDIRGTGQIMAVEYVADKAAKRFFEPKQGAHRLVSAKAFDHGVLVRALPFIEVTSFSPPLTMTRLEADEAVERFGKALDEITPTLKALAGA
jgi:L-2,4-diaminobutyrate transaminase